MTPEDTAAKALAELPHPARVMPGKMTKEIAE